QQRYATKAGARLAAVLAPTSDAGQPSANPVVLIDTDAASEVGSTRLAGVSRVTEASGCRILVGTSSGVAFIDPDHGTVSRTLDVGGPVHGLVAISDIENDPIYASVLTAKGPFVQTIIADGGKDPRKDIGFTLPGTTAGRAFFDQAARMVHIEGTVPQGHAGAGADPTH